MYLANKQRKERSYSRNVQWALISTNTQLLSQACWLNTIAVAFVACHSECLTIRM